MSDLKTLNQSAADTAYKDAEGWNKLIFENANRCHLHQDNLRWSLAGGFGAFFYGGILLLNSPILAGQTPLVHVLEAILLLIGTLYFFIILIEGWYYNLYLDYLVQCERNMARKVDLYPLSEFSRNQVKSFHPSFFFVLCLVAIANAFHLFQFVDSYLGSVETIICALTYVAILMAIAVVGRVPQRLDATS